MSVKSLEEYWNTSLSGSFNFDDDELDKNSSFSDSLDSGSADTIFGFSLEDPSSSQVTLPIHSLISKRNLDSVLSDVVIQLQSSVMPVREAVLKMFLGFPCNLGVYRSLGQKFELLKEAVAIEDGNIILKVLLYLKKTLKISIFYNHLAKQKKALKQYTNYLMQQLLLEELSDLYMAIGDFSDIIFLYYLSYKDDCSKEWLHSKILRFLAEHQSKLSRNDNKMFTNYKNFIKLQIDIGQSSESIIEHLAILCKCEYEKHPENVGPEKKIFDYKSSLKISEFQYEWILLNILGFLKMWKRLTGIFIKPNWLTKRNSIKSVIRSEVFINTLYNHSAPQDVLETFLVCMSDKGYALILAKRMNCYKFVINEYVNQRDRLGILTYKQRIAYQSEDYFYAENALRSNKKWKN